MRFVEITNLGTRGVWVSRESRGLAASCRVVTFSSSQGIAPYNTQWMKHILVLVKSCLPPSEECSDLLRDLKKEVFCHYFETYRELVANYTFLDVHTRQTTGVLVFPDPVPRPWGVFPLPLQTSVAIQESFGKLKNKNNLTVWIESERLRLFDVFVGATHAAKELLDMFVQNYAQLLLCDLPKKWTTMDIETFRITQIKIREKAVKTLL